MGCCCSSESDDEDLNDNLLNDESSDNLSSRLTDEFQGPTGDEYPIWVKDELVNECFNCELRFNLTERKHHCRRCRNIFCYACTSYKSMILAYNLKNEVKVCNECKTDLVSENNYLSIQKKVLINGENFIRYRMMGLTKYIVKLRLTSCGETLIYSNINENKSESVEIPMSSVEKITMISLSTLEISTKSKTYLFESDSLNTLKLWIESLNKSLYYYKQPTMRVKTDNNRSLKEESSRKMKNDLEQSRIAQATRENRNKALNNIRNKYGV